MRTITLSWNPSPSANVVGYRVYYGQASGSYSNVLDLGNQTTGDVPNLIEGTTFYFAVTAYAADGSESDRSDEFHYMPNPPVFLNMSTRANVGVGDNVLINGFIIGGAGEKKVIVRVSGPSLSNYGVPGGLPDPMVEIWGPEGLVAANDNWQDDPGAPELRWLGLAPADTAEAAMIIRLKPGNYTALVRGHGDQTGVALLEVYDGSR